jgi:aminoacyl tRNA synthase complex-interacting multifunctional protein 1
MASTATSIISQFPSPIRDLVESVSASNTAELNAFGKSDQERKDVEEWLAKVAATQYDENSLKDLDATLAPKTFLVGSSLTAADVALYGALHPIVSKLVPASYYALPSVTRYIDFVQNQTSIRSSSAALPTIIFDLDNAPKQERKGEPPKVKKEKGKENTTPADKSAATTSAEPKEAASKKKKGAEEKGKKESGASTPNAAAEPSEPMPSMIDLRVGKIVEVAKHPDADGLYVEQIDIGEPTGPRTVVSGLVNYIPIDQMKDRIIIVVCNLKPANMRGIKSFAMVLCASSKEGKDAGIEFVEPPEGSQPGDRVYFEGEQYENEAPVSQLNPKKKIFETIQPNFTTLDNRDAAWVDPKSGSVHKIVTKLGPCRPKTLVGASLS